MKKPIIPYVAAALALNTVLAIPDRLSALALDSFLRVAAELLLIVAIVALVPRSWQRPARGVLTVGVIGALLLKVANVAAIVAFDRAFDPMVDLALAPAGVDLLTRSHGIAFAIGAIAGTICVLAILIVAVWWALRELAAIPIRRSAAWGLLAVGTIVAAIPIPGTARASVRILIDEAHVVAAGIRDAAAFRTLLAVDPVREIDPPRLLGRLKGHDVLLVFVESYGRVAIDDARYAGTIGAQLDRMTTAFAAAGFATRSAWLTSPTFGGESWFAHSTVVSGLWVNEQRRYNALIKSTRSTLISDFRRAGWRTLAVLPEITMGWPESRFFAPDAVYDAPTLSFAGEPFGYITMADQYTFSKLQRAELASRERKPVMAEIALISSHAPWTPLPKLVPWDQIGDGTIFDGARTGAPPEEVWANPDEVRAQYGRAIGYDLETLESFVLTQATDDTVLIVLGDHQPMSFISGENAPREVPVHIIARDPAVLAAIADWRWQDGMRPNAQSPVWKMDTIRARLVEAFSTGAE